MEKTGQISHLPLGIGRLNRNRSACHFPAAYSLKRSATLPVFSSPKWK